MDHRALPALFELLATAPESALPEGLYLVDQVRQIAETAGLAVQPTPTLEELVRQSKREREGACQPESSDQPWLDEVCPPPVLSDVDALRGLRDQLIVILTGGDANERRRLFAALSLEFGLFPCLDSTGQATVRSRLDATAYRLAAVLVPSALQLVAEKRLSRVRRCVDPWCCSLFLDRSRAGHGRFCSRRCGTRKRAERRRAAEDCAATPLKK